MSTTIPAPLKTADIERFAQRAAQLEKIKPVVAYWCNYYVVDAILQQKLHSQSEECMTYTINLMERLEKVKKEEETNDAIHDEVAAQAYVEQFAQEVYQRADNAVRNKKANRQTVDTFSAARTFLELLSIWQKPLSEEVRAQIKFAKYHEVRILKALRAGEDPNVGDGIPSPVSTPAPPLDPNDPEVQNISMQPTVEDASDHEASSFQPPQNLPTHQEMHRFQQTGGDVSPLEETEQAQDGYFPPTNLNIPSAPTFPTESNDPNKPSPFSPMQPPASVDNSQNFYTTPSAPAPSTYSPPVVAPSFSPVQHQPYNPPQPPRNLNTFAPPAPQSSFHPSAVLPQHHSSPPPAPVPAPVPYEPMSVASTGFRTDDEAVSNAQKHAKWAISALNFDDVDTAVKELRTALRSLGA